MQALSQDDVLYLADDEQEAEALAEAIGGLTRSHVALYVPSSDTLPGDLAPASPANIGRRVAALRALRRHMQAGERPHMAVILSGEAAARRYPDPAAFERFVVTSRSTKPPTKPARYRWCATISPQTGRCWGRTAEC